MVNVTFLKQKRNGGGTNASVPLCYVHVNFKAALNVFVQIKVAHTIDERITSCLPYESREVRPVLTFLQQTSNLNKIRYWHCLCVAKTTVFNLRRLLKRRVHLQWL